jgi:hypothetical protein
MSVDLLIERQIARVRMLLNDTGHAVPEDHIRELLKDNYPSQVAEMIHAELHPPKAKASDPMTEPTRPTPIRIQRKRSKGWKMPENTVYVGRPTKWGNPFSVSASMSRWTAVNEFRRTITRTKTSRDFAELRGKNLACWCPLDQPCHADVLLEIANA